MVTISANCCEFRQSRPKQKTKRANQGNPIGPRTGQTLDFALRFSALHFPLGSRGRPVTVVPLKTTLPPLGGLAKAYSNSGILSNPISGSGVLPLPNLDALSLSSRAERGNLVGVAKAFQQHGSAEGAVPAAIARDSRSRETPCLSTLTPSSHPPSWTLRII